MHLNLNFSKGGPFDVLLGPCPSMAPFQELQSTWEFFILFYYNITIRNHQIERLFYYRSIRGLQKRGLRLTSQKSLRDEGVSFFPTATRVLAPTVEGPQIFLY